MQVPKTMAVAKTIAAEAEVADPRRLAKTTPAMKRKSKLLRRPRPVVSVVAAPEDEEVVVITKKADAVDAVVELLLQKTRRPMAAVARTTGRSRARLSLARLDIAEVAEEVEAARVVAVAKAKADAVATEMADMVAAIRTKMAAMAMATTSPDPAEVVVAATLPKATASTSRGPDVVAVAAVKLPSEHK